MDEAKALKHLLQRLYAAWPDLKANALVADAAWDEDWAARWCLVGYGLPLVARRHPSKASQQDLRLSPFESESVSHFTGKVPLTAAPRDSHVREVDGSQSASGLRRQVNRAGASLPRTVACPNRATAAGVYAPPYRRRSLRIDLNFAALAPYQHDRREETQICTPAVSRCSPGAIADEASSRSSGSAAARP